MSAANAANGGPRAYPPAHHLLHDLHLSFEQHDGERRVRAPLQAALLTDCGSLALGPAAVVVDVLAGGFSIDAVAPDWAVTSDMTLRLLGPCAEGELIASGRALRAGKTRIVVEVELRVDATPCESAPIAIAQIGFTRVPRREDTPVSVGPGKPESVTRFGAESAGLQVGFYEALGVLELDAAAGVLELELDRYQRNSLGALQGGVVMALAERAVQTRVRAGGGAPVVTTDVTMHYLAMGRAGPIRTRAHVLRSAGEATLVRVELRDFGADDRLLAVATATARRSAALG